MKENIEEDIKIVQEFLIEQNKRKQRLIDNPYRQLFYTDEELQAIEHILSDYKRVLKENEELKQSLIINKKLYEELCNKNNELKRENITLKRINHITEDVKIEDITEIMNKSYNEFIKQFIPKQKIKDKIEEYKACGIEEGYYHIFQEEINALQDLLEEKGE